MSDSFLDPSTVSLKICGVTTREDALQLVDLGIDALGVNFWPKSKRYVDPANVGWLKELAGKIQRVGVFVNADPELPLRLVRDGYLDLVQLHGDETPEDVAPLRDAGVPFVKAIGVKSLHDLDRAAEFGAVALLFDAHAPGVYGGTGEEFDWSIARDFMNRHPDIPVILAGGIVPENAADACSIVRPAALDVASGAEHSPGVKDFDKVKALFAAIGH